jgi:hypothetical protein
MMAEGKIIDVAVKKKSLLRDMTLQLKVKVYY